MRTCVGGVGGAEQENLNGKYILISMIRNVSLICISAFVETLSRMFNERGLFFTSLHKLSLSVPLIEVSRIFERSKLSGWFH